MTKEEQNDWLCRLRADLNNGVIFTPWNKKFTEALTSILEQKPCEDAISRQAVLDATVKKNSIWNSITNSKGENLEKIISQLPSVSSSEEPNRWIPVSEELPKKFSYVNCTCRSLIDDRASWVIETCYVPQPSNSPYSDWGNIPMLNHKECEVIAWVYREIPKPYKAEGSSK